MSQIWIHDVSVSYGGELLLDAVTLPIEKGERIGLLGRNGSGKSTLLRILNGDIRPDSGEIVWDPGIRAALLPQEVPGMLEGTVYEVVASGGREHLESLREYRDLTARLGGGGAASPATTGTTQAGASVDAAASTGAAAPTGATDTAGATQAAAPTGAADLLKQLERVQHRLETTGAWHFHQQVETAIGWVGLDGSVEFRTLSAGMKRRAFLARALADDPDVLLLDEPTNHLDIDTILWLEEFLLRLNKTLVFVTHDRSFLQRMATRIVEIDRGRLLSFDCKYDAYLERRQALLDAEEKSWQEFDKKLAKEEVWIRKGIRARRTRNEGRVRALEQLRLERARRRERVGQARISIAEAERSGKLVADAEKITFSYDDAKPIIDRFSTTIIRGDKVGIVGPNGCGKTTLLKVLLGELAPQSGRVRLGAGLQIAYFDQLRAQLDDERSVKDSVADGGETVWAGDRKRHVIGYLEDFLFSRDQIQGPVRLLSGGERNRLLLARLFSVPSNVLVLDEPTNDLDMETLALLEERLLTYNGTILLVTHDRAFLNNVVTSTIVFEGAGRLSEYVGGYNDWLEQRPEPQPAAPKAAPASSDASTASGASVATSAAEDDAASAAPVRKKAPARRGLSYKQKKELEALPGKIETLEEEQAGLIATLSSSDFYASADPTEVAATNTRLEELQQELDAAYHLWEELEALRESE